MSALSLFFFLIIFPSFSMTYYLGKSFHLPKTCDLKIDKDTEIICENVIYKKRTPYDTCCRKKIFDTRSESCCNGVPFNRTTHACCLNIDRYDLDPCLQPRFVGEWKPVIGQRIKFCCRDVIVDLRTEMCCNGLVYNRSETTNEDCKNPERLPVPLDQVTCGENTMKQKTEFCCNGIIYPNPDGNLGCCGLGKAYDQSKEVCCEKTDTTMAKENENDDSCCQDKTFNSKTQVCCKNSTIINKAAETDNACCDKVSYDSNLQGCCNGKVFNVKEATCRDNQIVQSCSGAPYDFKTHFCCEDVLRKREDGICCPFETIVGLDYIKTKFYPNVDSNTHTCCGYDLISKNVLEDRECCRDRMPDNPDCCGPFPKNKTDFCCGFNVIPAEEGEKVPCCTETKSYDELMCLIHKRTQ